MRGFIDWVMKVAEHLGGPGLALIAFLDSSFLSFPEVVDLLMVGLVAKYPDRMLWYAIWPTVGSIAGAYIIYEMARRGGEAFLRRRLHERHVDRAFGLFRKYGLLVVAIPSILPPPVPFKIFILAAGAARVKPLDFLIAITIGRGSPLFRRGTAGCLVRRDSPGQDGVLPARPRDGGAHGAGGADGRWRSVDLVLGTASRN